MTEKESYRLHYAPSLPLLSQEVPLERRLEKYVEHGISAVEYSCSGRPGCGLVLEPLEKVELLRSKLDRFGMEMGVFVVNPGAFMGAGLCDQEEHETFLSNLETAIHYHEVIENRFCTLLVGSEKPSLSREQQYDNVVQVLKKAADLLESTHLTVVVEPINLKDRPDSFLVKSDDAAAIVQDVGSSHVRILFDFFHQKITQEDLVEQIGKHDTCIGYYQFADVPSRKEPGTGGIDCRAIFKAIYDTGYQGLVGMEHEASQAGEAGLERCLEAYRQAESW